ncbi:lipopolysaccharide biosynthesis protein [uncultured Bifidobacterium sp.]|uniref:lipopolysaccharide biosynthesis protein n=1 Tax=uncultured Bifidobacterium sp. TaxID=165187 RepID=UPI0025962C47|nr:oligosaccharide flippase family protein [uncultured Bifidobacterium sp.]
MHTHLYKLRRIYSELSDTKKSVLWYTAAMVIQNGVLFLFTPVYTRILPDEQYGMFSVYQSWQQVVSIVSVVAMDRCVTVGFMKYEGNRRGFLSSLQALMTLTVLCCAVLVCLFHGPITHLIGLPLPIVLAMLAVSLMNNTLANWTWLQRYEYHYRRLAFVTVGCTAAIQIVSTVAIMLFPAVDGGTVLIMSSTAIRVGLYGIIYIAVFAAGRRLFDREYWRFSFSYSLAVVPHALSQIILNSSARILIDKLCGRAEAAYYGVTYSAAMVLNIIMTSVSSAIQPWFFERIRARDYRNIRRKTNVFLLMAAGFAVAVSLFAPEILAILAPVSYRSALGTFPPTAAGIFFNCMYLCFANFESYYEKPFYFSIATATGAIANVALNLICIPLFGFVAAGYTTMICYMLFAFMHYRFMRRICRQELDDVRVFDVRFILLLSVGTVLATIGVSIMYGWHPAIRYGILIVVAIAALVCRRALARWLHDLL